MTCLVLSTMFLVLHRREHSGSEDFRAFDRLVCLRGVDVQIRPRVQILLLNFPDRSVDGEVRLEGDLNFLGSCCLRLRLLAPFQM